MKSLEELRNKLQELLAMGQRMTDPEVVAVSPDLDRLVVEAMKKLPTRQACALGSFGESPLCDSLVCTRGHGLYWKDLGPLSPKQSAW